MKQRIEQQFHRSLRTVTDEILNRLHDHSTVNEIIAVLQDMSTSPALAAFAEQIAHRMAIELYNENARTWRQAAGAIHPHMYRDLRRNLQGPIGVNVQHQIQENAHYITTMPQDIAEEVTRYVARQAMAGRRPEAIEDEIQRLFPEHTRAKAKLIARTEVSKAQSAVVEQRARQYGVNWYVWRPVGGSRGDGRTRLSHRHMAGVLVNWDDPPSPEKLVHLRSRLGTYHAGCCPNCRCYAEPVIDLDMVQWPCKLYRAGSIIRVRRRLFEKMM